MRSPKASVSVPSKIEKIEISGSVNTDAGAEIAEEDSAQHEYYVIEKAEIVMTYNQDPKRVADAVEIKRIGKAKQIEIVCTSDAEPVREPK